jgi:hypothetical protein
MRKLLILAALAFIIFNQSCDFVHMETIHGNGNVTTDTRNVAEANRIKTRGSFDVEIVQGTSASVKIEADANLIPYIITANEDGMLVIRTKDNVGLQSNTKIKVYVTTPTVEEIALNGSGNVTADSKITGSDHLKLSISGSGDMKLEVDAPKVESSIAGSGNINISGETKDSKIDIAGNGDYKAENLQAENVEVHIAGSGNARVFSSTSLDVHIAGSGDIFYKGSPSITQHVAGSGSIKQIQ